jgi:two-component system, NarL family, invasion response regulator UvrY
MELLEKSAPLTLSRISKSESEGGIALSLCALPDRPKISVLLVPVHEKCKLMARVLIADDHAVVRRGYKQFLAAEPSVREIGEASSGTETIEVLRSQSWDLLMMDIHMPDRGGLDILKYVKAGYPDLPVLIMSGFPEEQYARYVLRAGASGFLSKDGTPQEMLKAVRLVLSGGRYVSPSLSESMAADLLRSRDHEKPLHAGLSMREMQIFCKLAVGVSVSGISRELSLSVKTVSTYRTRLLKKLGFATNADITSYALRNHLVP